MSMNKWRYVKDGHEEPNVAQCLMCKEFIDEQFGMNFCSFCGTEWDGQLECSKEGKKWDDIVTRRGRSIYDNHKTNRPWWKIRTRNKVCKEVRPSDWRDICLYKFGPGTSGRVVLERYKEIVKRESDSCFLVEIAIVRVMEDLFLRQVVTSGWIGGKRGVNQSNNVSEMLSE